MENFRTRSSKIVLVSANCFTKLWASFFLEKVSWCMQEGERNFLNFVLCKSFGKYFRYNPFFFAADVHNFSGKNPKCLVEIDSLYVSEL